MNVDVAFELASAVHESAGTGPEKLTWSEAWARLWRVRRVCKSFNEAVHERAKQHVYILYSGLMSFSRVPPLDLRESLCKVLNHALFYSQDWPVSSIFNAYLRTLTRETLQSC